VSEDVTVTVTETVHSITGTVRLAGGIAPNVGLRLSGGKKRVVYTDAVGRYRFDDLVAGTYVVKLDTSRSYVAAPRSASAVVSASDVHGVDLLVTPR